MECNHFIQSGYLSQASYGELEAIFQEVDASQLLSELGKRRWQGRPGYDLTALWRGYLASFKLNMGSTNDLIRSLQDDPLLRELCGFGDTLPHRTTFNRFVKRLADYPDLVRDCLCQINNQLPDLLPGFGDVVSIDATDVRSHSNPQKKKAATGLPSDPEARWGVKHSARSKETEKTEWFFGYKVHMVADATYDLPIDFKVTAGNRNDSPELPAVIETAMDTFDWFDPHTVLADRGYDATTNFEGLYLLHGIDPIIHIRKPTAQDGLYDGIFTADAVPTCLGMEPMEFVGRDGKGGLIFRCRSEGCHLKDSTQGGTKKCDTVVVEDPSENLRVLGGYTRRGSAEWKAKYKKRWSVERVFKSQKESRRLEDHFVRGLKNITLHCLMSTLSFQASALVKAKTGNKDSMRWMVRKVA